MRKLTFEAHLTAPPKPRGIDAATTLRHLAIITYAIDPVRLQGVIPKRFRLIIVDVAGTARALLSVVPFINTKFRLAAYPSPHFTMPQVNYRVYVTDRQTGEPAVWFLGTVLGSWAVLVNRYVWKMPWRKGKIRLDCLYDGATRTYQRYTMKTENEWAPATVALVQDADESIELPGFPDLESGLVTLAHPYVGFYRRLDGKIGVNRVWHKRLDAKPAKLVSASLGMLGRAGWVTESEQASPHSVLLVPKADFMSRLPPRVVGGAGDG